MQVSITETLSVSPVTHIAPLRFLVRWGDVGVDTESRISEVGEELIEQVRSVRHRRMSQEVKTGKTGEDNVTWIEQVKESEMEVDTANTDSAHEDSNLTTSDKETRSQH